jgi:hypothetical protein
MTIVTITLDDESGLVNVHAEIPGGFDITSPACVLANIMLNTLDKAAVRAELKDAPVVPLVRERTKSLMADVGPKLILA